MKIFYSLIILFSLLVMSCSSVRVNKLSDRDYKPVTDPTKVIFYFDPPVKKYEKIALMEATAYSAWSKPRIRDVLPELKKRAMKLGANGIFITGYEKKSKRETLIYAMAIYVQSSAGRRSAPKTR